LPLIAGDAIQNLMGGLDHLAYQLVCSDTWDKPPNPKWIYFPIRESLAKYEAAKSGKMEGASPDTLLAIDALKPYKGGNDQLWVLFSLNNVEKHRLLLTVGSAFQSFNLGAYMGSEIQTWVDRVKPGSVAPVIDFYLRPADKLFPLKVGDELFIAGPDDEPNDKIQFRFNVALSEPEIIEAASLLETLHQLTTLVEGIVSALTPRLKATP
jgi:hypothetical protein